jgi:hypothetical protein
LLREETLVVTLGYVETKVELETSRPAYGIIYIGYRKGAFDGCRVDSAVIPTFSDLVFLFYIDYRGGHPDRASRSYENTF